MAGITATDDLRMVRASVLVVTIALFYGLFYRKVVARWGRAVDAVMRRTALRDRHSRRDLDRMSKLCGAALAQTAFALFTILWTGTRPPLVPVSAGVMLIAPILGFAELSLATLVGRGGVTLRLIAMRSDESGPTVQNWLMEGRGGWIAQFTATLKVMPTWFAVLVIAVYVTGEEVVFRTVVLTTLRPYGAVVAVGVSAALFIAVQVFHMPSLRAAFFPAAGALVIGFVHGTLYWMVMDILSLALAHLSFLLGALFSASRVARPANRAHD